MMGNCFVASLSPATLRAARANARFHCKRLEITGKLGERRRRSGPTFQTRPQGSRPAGARCSGCVSNCKSVTRVAIRFGWNRLWQLSAGFQTAFVRQPSGLSKVHGQITKKGARLVLGECRAAEAEVPEISVGQVLCLHTQRGRSAQHPESVSAAQGERGCWWGSRHVIDAGGIRSEVKDRDVRGEARQRGHRVTGVDRCRDNAVPHPTGFQLAPESLTRCGIVFSL